MMKGSEQMLNYEPALGKYSGDKAMSGYTQQNKKCHSTLISSSSGTIGSNGNARKK